MRVLRVCSQLEDEVSRIRQQQQRPMDPPEEGQQEESQQQAAEDAAPIAEWWTRVTTTNPTSVATTTAAADTSAAASAARPTSPCACAARAPNICRCVPRDVRHMFRNEKVPDSSYFKGEWVRRFGHGYQARAFLPVWLLASIPNEHPTDVRQRVLEDCARSQWQEIERGTDAQDRARSEWQEIEPGPDVTPREEAAKTTPTSDWNRPIIGPQPQQQQHISLSQQRRRV